MTSIRTLLFAAAIAGCSASLAAPAQDSPTGSASDRKIAALPPAKLASTAKLDKAIATYFGTVNSQRTYIQTDKPLYQPGETIWFRADVRTTKTLIGGPPTGVTMQLLSPRGAVAVSYTHLRAHETPEHLVCR